MDSHRQPAARPAFVLIKGLSLFLVVNLLLSIGQPLPALGRLSAYNWLFPGRQRLPYGDVPSQAYNLSLYNLEAMFASHELAAPGKAEDEFRVILIGDSSIWGYLLQPDETLSAAMNQAGLSLPDGRRLKAYNLGYPVMSAAKDLLVLSYAMRYAPDLIVWPITLESLPYDKQLAPPLLQNNPQAVRDLISRYRLSLDANDPGFFEPGWWQRTLLGRRRELADMLRLQAYGVMWAATGIDQAMPAEFTARQENLPSDESFHDLQPPLQASDLALEILEAGRKITGETPILLVNEPMFVSKGVNSQVRYNYFYPRWAYDDYRALMAEYTLAQGWSYLDAGQAVSPDEFTNTAIHMTPAGTAAFARLVLLGIVELVAGQP